MDKRWLSIIDNVLEITRIENDKVQIEYTIKDIEQIFDDLFRWKNRLLKKML